MARIFHQAFCTTYAGDSEPDGCRNSYCTGVDYSGENAGHELS